ncbi:SUMO-ubiquitin ligase [Malassezia pachydermatis]
MHVVQRPCDSPMPSEDSHSVSPSDPQGHFSTASGSESTSAPASPFLTSLPPRPSVIEVSDEGEAEDDCYVEAVRKLTAADLRKRKIEAAREAMRRAATAPRKPPSVQNALFSTYRCPICLCPPQNVSVTPCGHIFCGSCLFDSLATNARQEHDAPHEFASAASAQHLFTPLGSGAAMTLANVAGVSVDNAREILQERRQQRQTQATMDPSPSRRDSQLSATRLRATNGTERIKGLCPVCRSPIRGGFTGPSRKGILGLEILLGTPRESPSSDTTPSSNITTSPTPPAKRARHDVS